MVTRAVIKFDLEIILTVTSSLGVPRPVSTITKLTFGGKNEGMNGPLAEPLIIIGQKKIG